MSIYIIQLFAWVQVDINRSIVTSTPKKEGMHMRQLEIPMFFTTRPHLMSAHIANPIGEEQKFYDTELSLIIHAASRANTCGSKRIT
jgi:hypothetical protein